MSEALAKKRKIQKYLGMVEVEADRCKGCGFCVEFCPSAALELSKEFNVKGYHPPLLVDQNYCSGCDLCGLYCPDFAIFGYRVGPNPSFKKDK
jgi:2-oxoglutarate ferredoxin oxidoreductase subunit delta